MHDLNSLIAHTASEDPHPFANDVSSVPISPMSTPLRPTPPTYPPPHNESVLASTCCSRVVKTFCCHPSHPNDYNMRRIVTHALIIGIAAGVLTGIKTNIRVNDGYGNYQNYGPACGFIVGLVTSIAYGGISVAVLHNERNGGCLRNTADCFCWALRSCKNNYCSENPRSIR